MSGFWLPLGLVLASIGLAATLIAKKHGRISDETYKLIGVVWSIAIIMICIGIGWSSYQMDRPLRHLEGIKVRSDALQERIKATKGAQQQLSRFTDPQQGADTAALTKRRADNRKEAVSISDESKALTEDIPLARSQFDEVNQARMHRKFILVLCVLVLASTLILGAVYRDAFQPINRAAQRRWHGTGSENSPPIDDPRAGAAAPDTTAPMDAPPMSPDDGVGQAAPAPSPDQTPPDDGTKKDDGPSNPD